MNDWLKAPSFISFFIHLVLGDAGRHEDAAQHQVLHVEALRLAGRDVAPGHAGRHLVGVGERLAVEHAERAHLVAAPLRDGLDRVVDGGVDMVADQLHRHLAAAAERDIGELGAGCLLDGDGDDLVFLLGAGAAHLELAGGRSLHGIDVILDRLVGFLGVHPQHELVEREHGDRRQVLPVERNAGRERRGEQVRQRDDDLVRVAARGLDVEESFAARAAGLVDRDDRLLHQVVLGDDALDHAGHLVGAAAGAGRHDELHLAGRLPRRLRG
jgi:hypothetical protein